MAHLFDTSVVGFGTPAQLMLARRDNWRLDNSIIKSYKNRLCNNLCGTGAGKPAAPVHACELVLLKARLLHNSKAHFLKPALAVGRPGCGKKLDEDQIKAFVKNLPVLLANATFGNSAEITIVKLPLFPTLCLS